MIHFSLPSYRFPQVLSIFHAPEKHHRTNLGTLKPPSYMHKNLHGANIAIFCTFQFFFVLLFNFHFPFRTWEECQGILRENTRIKRTLTQNTPVDFS